MAPIKVLPIGDHIELLLSGEAHESACEVNPEDKFELPPWYDHEKYKRGRSFIEDNIFSQFTNNLAGLICVLAVPSILEILIKTHKSSNKKTAFRRYMSTLFHVYSWYTNDLTPGTESWKSLKEIRNRHFNASKTSRMKGRGHISQRDMVYTQFGFFALGFLAPEKVGFSNYSQEDMEGFIHFWQTIGYMLGIEDRYNLCRSSVEETKEICEAIRREVYCRYLHRPPEYFLHMLSAMLEGMQYHDPMLSEGSFVYYTMWLVGVEDYSYDGSAKSFSIKYLVDDCGSEENTSKDDEQRGTVMVEKQLGWWNRLMLKFIIKTHSYLVQTRIGRIYFNYDTKISIFFAKYFPYMSFWYFGFKSAFIDMFAEDSIAITPMVKNGHHFAKIKY